MTGASKHARISVLGLGQVFFGFLAARVDMHPGEFLT